MVATVGKEMGRCQRRFDDLIVFMVRFFLSKRTQQ